jgi:dephospho-CoA kinase
MNSPDPSRFPNAVVLTGGISTGKSTVARMFAGDGFAIIDADKVAHEVLQREKELIVAHFGSGILHEGEIDRKRLGTLIFADPEKRKILEGALHPLIRKDIFAQAERLEKSAQPYIVDIPLFFESGSYPMERVIVVYAPKEIQLKRLMQRDGYNMQEALQRLDAQIPIEEKRSLATYLIDNSQDLDHLVRQYRDVRKQLSGDDR